MERWKGKFVFFLKIFEGVEENSKFYGEMYFWDYGVGDFWVEEEKGCNILFIVIKVNYNNVN